MIRFAVVGTNFVVDRFVEAAQGLSDFHLEAVCSRTASRGAECARRWGAPRWIGGIDALRADQNIDAVYLATPNLFHEAQTVALLQSGKHVLCEKPIAPNAPALRRMARAAEESGRVLMEAMIPAHTPGWSIVQEQLPSLGAIRRATLSFCQYSSRYDRFKQGDVDNAFNPALLNGALMDLGSYCIAVALMLFGAPADVTGVATFLPNGLDGQGTLLFHYPDKLVELLYSKIAQGALPSQIQGEAGSLLVDGVSLPRWAELVPRSGERQTIALSGDAPDMRYEIEHFIAAVGGALDWRAHLADSLRAAAVLERAQAALGIGFGG